MASVPSSITQTGPRRSISRPVAGPSRAATRKPKLNAPAVVARSQPNSSRIAGNSSENEVRAFTPTAMVTKATATTAQP